MTEKKKLERKTVANWIIAGMWVLIAILVVWMIWDMEGWTPTTDLGELPLAVMNLTKTTTLTTVFVAVVSALTVINSDRTDVLKKKVDMLEKKLEEMEKKEGEE